MGNYTTNKKYFETKLIKSNIKAKYIINNENFEVINTYEDEQYIGYECKSKKRKTICKHCGKTITNIKDKKVTYPMYGLIDKKPVILKLEKKLFYCKDCKKSTQEEPINKKPYAQKANEFINMLIDDLREQTTYKAVSKRYKVSVTNVIYQFDKYRKTINKPSYKEIKNVNIDELRFIPEQGNYQCVIKNADSNEIIDILPNRYSVTIEAYFKENLPHIELVTQDFWQSYKNAIKKVNATVEIVGDKFHLVRFVNWGFNRTRVKIQKETGIKLGRSWKLQTKSRHRLDNLAKRKVDKIVSQHPKLLAAYKAKNYFCAIIRMNSKELYLKHIVKWKEYIHLHELTEFYFIETTLNNWHDEILNMLESKYSNGSIERINRTIKQAKNIAFGFRNLERTTDLLKIRVCH